MRWLPSWFVIGVFVAGFAASQPTRPPLPTVKMRAAPEHPGWSVDQRTGCWVWSAYPQPNETVHWSEGCGPDGKAAGRGVLERQFDGETERYEGDLRDGKPNGRGVETSGRGDRYEGGFRDGKWHGHGVLSWASGNRYEGAFRDGMQHGRGVLTWFNGDRYEGEWCDGMQNGKGVLAWANGDRYEGRWRNGQPNGHGVYVLPNGNRYEGEWRDGYAEVPILPDKQI